MTAHTLVIDGLLGVVVVTTWIGIAGMLRMRDATQALHYLAVPGTLGVAALTAAVFVQSGVSPLAWKMLLIAVILFGINSVVTHATGRAFRTRELGHWQPRDGDPVEFVPKTADVQEPQS